MSQTHPIPSAASVATADTSATFLSYSHEDSSFVLKLVSELKAAGADVWLDKMDISPGQPWDRSIQDALACCSRLLVVLSPTSVDSTNVLDEVSFALDNRKPIIPVLHRDCEVPFRLRRLQYIDFRGEYAHGFAELLKTLQAPQPDCAIWPDHTASSHRADTSQSGGPVSQHRPETRGTGLLGSFPGSPATKASVSACLVLLVASLLWFVPRARQHSPQSITAVQASTPTGAISQPSLPTVLKPDQGLQNGSVSGSDRVVPAPKPKPFTTHQSAVEAVNQTNSAEYQQLRLRLVETQEQVKAAATFWAPIKADLARSNQSLRPEVQTALGTLSRSTNDAGRLLQAGDLTGARMSLDSADKQLGVLQRYQAE